MRRARGSVVACPRPEGAPRASRGFVSRTLRDWQLGRVIPFASLVVSELVASSSRHVSTDMDVSLAWNLGALRLAVRDHGPAQLPHSDSPLDLYGRGRSVVAGLSRTFGFLPAADGGQVVWAVLDAPRSRQSARQNMSGHADLRDSRELGDGPDSPAVRDGSGPAAVPLWPGSSRPGTLELARPRRISDRPTAGRRS